MPIKPDPLNYTPVYTEEELGKAKRWGFSQEPSQGGWLTNQHGQYFFLKPAAYHAIREAHQSTHCGKEALHNWLVRMLLTPGLRVLIEQEVKSYPICNTNNPNTGPPHGPNVQAIQVRGNYPGKDWQIEFTVMPRATGNFTYLLVLVDTFSRWTEAFPQEKRLPSRSPRYY